MSEALSELERRVLDAVERLGALREERDGLAREVERLHARVEALEASPPVAGDGAGWAADRARTLDELRVALDELRAG